MSEILRRTVHAPWSVQEVELLNDMQTAGYTHPYTCGNCRDNLGTRYIRNDDGTDRRMTDLDESVLDGLRILHDGNDAAFFNESLVRRIIHKERILVATLNGWICPTCDYKQDWYVSFN